MMEVTSSDAIFAGNQMEVPKSVLIAFTYFMGSRAPPLDFLHKFSQCSTFFCVRTK